MPLLNRFMDNAVVIEKKRQFHSHLLGYGAITVLTQSLPHYICLTFLFADVKRSVCMLWNDSSIKKAVIIKFCCIYFFACET